VKRLWPLGKISCRRVGAGLEHVEGIEAARFSVGWKKDWVSAAKDRPDDHEIARQVETLEPRSACFAPICLRMRISKVSGVFGDTRTLSQPSEGVGLLVISRNRRT
jgi:hypothetical protein